MIALLNWRLWAGLALVTIAALGGWKCFKLGQQDGLQQLAAYKLEQTSAALADAQAYRTKEASLNQSLRSLTNAYITEKNAHAAAAARADDSLRQLETSLGSAATLDPAAAVGADDLTRTRYVLGQCATAFTALAQTADTIEARLTGLQAYVGTVCVNPGVK